MPRYIDAKKIRYCWMYDSDGEEHDGVTLQSVIAKVPTADVVPKSEVDKARQQGYESGKREVAGKIFKEIEEIFNAEYKFYSEQYRKCQDADVQSHLDGELTGMELLAEKIGELKEKYTEGE